MEAARTKYGVDISPDRLQQRLGSESSQMLLHTPEPRSSGVASEQNHNAAANAAALDRSVDLLHDVGPNPHAHLEAPAEATQSISHGLQIAQSSHNPASVFGTAASNGQLPAAETAPGNTLVTEQQTPAEGSRKPKRQTRKALKAAAQAAEQVEVLQPTGISEAEDGYAADLARSDVGVEAHQSCQDALRSLVEARRWSEAGASKLSATFQELVQVRPSYATFLTAFE